MHILLFIPISLLFLYVLYRLVKDDHIFIRKGVSLEQSFDCAFITLWSGLIAGRLLYLVSHIFTEKNILFQFFSLKNYEFSLVGGIIGGMISIYFLGKYRRIPLGRLGDFFSMALLSIFPLGFLVQALVVKKEELLFVFLNAIVYFILLLFFAQFLYPKIMNRTLKEGTLSLLFLVFYTIISLTTSIFISLKDLHNLINPENIILFLLLLFSMVFLVKQRTSSPQRRTITR
jgi:hypothetical protein